MIFLFPFYSLVWILFVIGLLLFVWVFWRCFVGVCFAGGCGFDLDGCLSLELGFGFCCFFRLFWVFMVCFGLDGCGNDCALLGWGGLFALLFVLRFAITCCLLLVACL